MEKETIVVRTWFKASQDGICEKPVSFTYTIDFGFYRKTYVNLLYKIYGDVYHQIKKYGVDGFGKNRIVVTILPQGYVSSDLLRYCSVIKAWLDFIEFQTSVDVGIMYEKEE